MRAGFTVALAMAVCVAVAPRCFAQQPAAGDSAPGQSKGAAANQKAPAASQSSGNPFPGNSGSVPILPSGPTANVPQGSYGPENAAALPDVDHDPVRSPDSADPDSGQGFSDSLSGISSLLPQPDTSVPGKGKDQQVAPLPQETPANDISVGNYYLDNKNWRAALSRFQSAMVLDPDDPEVYWGLAESERHMGDYADARAHYMKVIEYDPGSRHAKDARKALRDPEIENAKNPAAGQAPKP